MYNRRSNVVSACPPRGAPPSPVPLFTGNSDSPAMPRAPLGAIHNRAAEAGLARVVARAPR